jgi:hypothetical protein
VRRLVYVAALAGAICLLASGSALAWHYTFREFFNAEGGGISSGVAEVKKCTGGKLGTYKFRDFAQVIAGDAELSLEVTAKMPVLTSWAKMKHVEVETHASSDFPPEVVDGLANGFHDFFETVFTKYRPKDDQLEIRHGALVLYGNEVFGPDQSATKFKPKPGC